MAERLMPEPTPESAEFWAGLRRRELRIQRCRACERWYFYPRPFCPRCWSTDVQWRTASGRATLESYVVCYRPAPGFEDCVPYVIAVVTLAEGPRMMSNIVASGVDAGTPPEHIPQLLPAGLPLEVDFGKRGIGTGAALELPLFRPGTPRAQGADR
ncbi:MAG: OB-fold domain-containing protein [Chloroflexi bacterium]|nr:OB-fold domain-containing protein [Chloroflexota bacterium]